MTGVAADGDVRNWKSIALVSGGDRITQIHITNLLLSHNIESVMEGSMVYDVSVPPSKAEQATKLLRTDAPKSGYFVSFGSNDVMRAPESKALVSRISVSSALKKPEFGSDEALGKFLRSKRIAALTRRYPYITSISIRERQYFSAPRTRATGYEVELELQGSLRKGDEGYRGRYQVYDGGGSVRFLGANEWGRHVGEKRNT